MVVHQPVFAALWATVYVLMSVRWPAWRVQGAVWRSVRATLVIEWRGECAGMGPWEREERGFFTCAFLSIIRNHDPIQSFKNE